MNPNDDRKRRAALVHILGYCLGKKDGCRYSFVVGDLNFRIDESNNDQLTTFIEETKNDILIRDLTKSVARTCKVFKDKSKANCLFDMCSVIVKDGRNGRSCEPAASKKCYDDSHRTPSNCDRVLAVDHFPSELQNIEIGPSGAMSIPPFEDSDHFGVFATAIIPRDLGRANATLSDLELPNTISDSESFSNSSSSTPLSRSPTRLGETLIFGKLPPITNSPRNGFDPWLPIGAQPIGTAATTGGMRRVMYSSRSQQKNKSIKTRESNKNIQNHRKTAGSMGSRKSNAHVSSSQMSSGMKVIAPTTKKKKNKTRDIITDRSITTGRASKKQVRLQISERKRRTRQLRRT
jgi:hypothetical protein